jgi:type I restriction enzyme, R subunit
LSYDDNMTQFNESTAELAALDWLQEIGYSVAFGPGIAPDEPGAERGGYDEVVLYGRLQAALRRTNPHIPPAALDEAIRQVERVDSTHPVSHNKTHRRPDIILFANGLPLVVIELKNPCDEEAMLERAFNQIQT